MKNFIFATTLALASTGAFALDKVLDPSENYQSPLADHSPGSKADQLSPMHDHGEDTAKEFIEHGHDLPIRDDHPHSNMAKMHDHDEDTVKNFVEHKED